MRKQMFITIPAVDDWQIEEIFRAVNNHLQAEQGCTVTTHVPSQDLFETKFPVALSGDGIVGYGKIVDFDEGIVELHIFDPKAQKKIFELNDEPLELSFMEKVTGPSEVDRNASRVPLMFENKQVGVALVHLDTMEVQTIINEECVEEMSLYLGATAKYPVEMSLQVDGNRGPIGVDIIKVPFEKEPEERTEDNA